VHIEAHPPGDVSTADAMTVALIGNVPAIRTNVATADVEFSKW
jgi:hypothetical protein